FHRGWPSGPRPSVTVFMLSNTQAHGTPPSSSAIASSPRSNGSSVIRRVHRTASVRLYFRRAAKKTRRTTSVPSGTHASPQSTWRNSPASPSKRITGAAAAARTRFRPATKRYQLAALAVYGVVASARQLEHPLHRQVGLEPADHRGLPVRPRARP